MALSPGRPEIFVAADGAGVAAEAALRFERLAAEACAERGRFAVALAGGSTPAALYRLLAQPPHRDAIAWPNVHVYFGDERCVPPDHPDSNYRMAREMLLAHVPLAERGVQRMAGELGEESAARYAGQLPERFDLVLLGMGDDGHTASLFPGMPAVTEQAGRVVWTPVPTYVRPFVPRLTLTLPVINAARQVLFLVIGAAKAPRVRQVLVGEPPAPQPLPAGLVQAEKCAWLLDHAAAQQLPLD